MNLKKITTDRLKKSFYNYLTNYHKLIHYTNKDYIYIYDEFFYQILNIAIDTFNKNIKYLNNVNYTLKTDKYDYLNIIFLKKLENYNTIKILENESYFIKRIRQEKLKKIEK